MRRTVTIDFETFSELDLRKSSPWAYAEHPSTRVLCMGYQFHDSEINATHLWTPVRIQYAPPFLGKGELLHFEAHNAEFERAIWETIMVPQFGFTEDVTWDCTAARAAALALPRKLAEVNKVLGLETEKDDGGHRLMLQVCKPRKPSKKNPATNWLDDEDKMTRLYEYCLQDVRAQVALSKRIRQLSAREKEIWDVDQRINQRGISYDSELVDSASHLWEENCRRLNAELSDLTWGFVTKGTQNKKLLTYLQGGYPDITSVNKESVESLLLRNKWPDVDRVLRIRQESSKSSVAKYSAISTRASLDGRVRSLFMFHGASTGRWAGKAVQLQNLPTGRGLETFDPEICIATAKFGDLDLLEALYEKPMDYLSACIRGAFVPGEGKTFACADYSAIEARVLLWLVGDPALDKFRQGVDIYKDLASKIYHIPIEEVTDAQRQLGKQGILGLGYGMGPDKFVATCASYGIEIDEELAKNVVDTYRKTFQHVVRFWYALENTALECIRTKKQTQCGRLRWGIKDDFLHCQLPSGRLLSYYKPSIQEVETPWGEMKLAVHFEGPISPAGFGLQHTYGGKLTENVVQAIARDVLADAMVHLEKEGFPIVMHVHDEVLCEVPIVDFQLKDRKNHFENIMNSPPDWAPDLPIEIDVWYGNRYHK